MNSNLKIYKCTNYIKNFSYLEEYIRLKDGDEKGIGIYVKNNKQ